MKKDLLSEKGKGQVFGKTMAPALNYGNSVAIMESCRIQAVKVIALPLLSSKVDSSHLETRPQESAL